MSEERRRILNLLSEGKLTAAEAEDLIAALPGASGASSGASSPAGEKKSPRYLRVMVEDKQGDHGGKVNVRVPMNLIRAGVRLAALLPSGVHAKVNEALHEKGIDMDISKVKPENLEELVEHLSELTVDVEGNKGEKVRIFCE